MNSLHNLNVLSLEVKKRLLNDTDSYLYFLSIDKA